jgi:predicted O-methyltransferase YrrM
MSRRSLPIVPQESADPRETFAAQMARLAPLPERLSAALTEAEDVARREGIPVIGRLEGAVVQMLAGLCGGARVLDIGTAIGYSALWLASVLPEGGRVTSIEIDPERAVRAREYIAKAGYEDRVEIMVGDAFEIIPRLGSFDLIFQDVMKHRYFGSDPCLAVDLLKLCCVHLADDGVMVIDNAFCGGHVITSDGPDEFNEVTGVRNVNETLAKDPDFLSVLLPLRDGLWVARRLGADARTA